MIPVDYSGTYKRAYINANGTITVEATSAELSSITFKAEQ
jgi:hypothetical protein